MLKTGDGACQPKEREKTKGLVGLKTWGGGTNLRKRETNGLVRLKTGGGGQPKE